MCVFFVKNGELKQNKNKKIKRESVQKHLSKVNKSYVDRNLVYIFQYFLNIFFCSYMRSVLFIFNKNNNRQNKKKMPNNLLPKNEYILNSCVKYKSIKCTKKNLINFNNFCLINYTIFCS